MTNQEYMVPLWRDRSGVTAIEYAMIAAFIAVVIVASLHSIGTSVSTIFNNVATGL